MGSLRVFHFIGCLVVLVGISWLFSGCGTDSNHSSSETLLWLDSLRDQKIEEIQDHFQGLQNAAQEIAHDQLMVEFFNELLPAPGESTTAKEVAPLLSHQLDSRFVRQYGNFYDLLFVARDGFVFHSIKQEPDHLTNLFTGRWQKTSLARGLQNNPDLPFVDYESYGPSAEPAAFFVIPVKTDNRIQGWFLLQYASNTLNSILGDKTHMGRTGEVFLVNKNGLMLSDSRFVNHSTVLEISLNEASVTKVFSERKGHTISTDYRGVSVFSSFASFDLLGTPWAIFAEIDEEEIHGRVFLDNPQDLTGVLADMAQARTLDISRNGDLPGAVQNRFRVDMGEILRVTGEQICWTPGVGPCTAVAAIFPEKFGYLLHLGPTDEVYKQDPLTGSLLGPHQTRHLQDLTERISHFDVVPSDLNKIRYVVVATHQESLQGILELLLNEGVGLSQIKFLYHSEADFANVRLDMNTGSVQGEWVKSEWVKSEWVNSGPTSAKSHFDSHDQADLGSLLQSHFQDQGVRP